MTDIKKWQERIKPEYQGVPGLRLDYMQAEIDALRALRAQPDHSELIKRLNQPQEFYFTDQMSAKKANALYTSLMQDAADALERAQQVVREPLTDAQLKRVWNNSPEMAKNVTSCEAFKRVFRLAEAAHRIAAAPKGQT